MGMLNLPNDIMEELIDFYANEISNKLFIGVTYGLILKGGVSDSKIQKYLNLKQRVMENNTSNGDIMRAFELCNGYIFDLGLRPAQELALNLIKSTYSTDEQLSKNDIMMIRDLPINKRKADLKALADKCLSVAKEHPNDKQIIYDVALYSRNSLNEIKFAAQGPKGEKLQVRYDAFSLKHTDLDELNRAHLVTKRFRVSSIQPCEILPTRTGVRFRLYLERLDANIKIQR